MSKIEAEHSERAAGVSTTTIERILAARGRSLDTIDIGRVLPSVAQRRVGPFVFFDHMGPAELGRGEGLDVRPHPHIHLATVTYLFEGELIHRDSLGYEQPIRPGDVNWMNAGRGIVHSERTPPELRRIGTRLHGIQLWVALPRAHEDSDPSFHHYPSDTLPCLEVDGVTVHLLAGAAYGATSPVATLSPLLYFEARMPAGSRLELPSAPERAIYVVEGAVTCEQQRADARHMLVFAQGSTPVIEAASPTRLVLLGGEPLDGPRHIWWNFVSSSQERIEEAKRDWREGRFPRIPGDDRESIPLPEDT